MRPGGPYPFLVLQGPPGSGKTFAARVLRSLIDPSAVPLCPIPSSPRDLYNLARQCWILAFDHVSELSPAVSDALCRLSSGLGVPVRETSGLASQPVSRYYKCPVILTVTGRWSPPPEVARRAITITLPELPDAARRPETALLSAFSANRSAILPPLCSAVRPALRRFRADTPPPGHTDRKSVV